MTTRIKGFVVTLAEDLREDDAEAIRLALSMVRGVVDVDAVEEAQPVVIATCCCGDAECPGCYPS